MKNNWLDQNEYPFVSNFFEVNGQKLHYIDEGQGKTILFVHGTPSWSFDFRKVIKNLRTSYRCIAIDHIGFGLSDKPAQYDYSTINHSKTLENFILAKDLRSFALVVHDFGGPIGLNMAMNCPDRVKALIILNSWLWSSANDPEYIKFAKVLKSPLLPFLYKFFNFSPKYILPKSFGDHKPTKSVLKHYTKPFARISERNGTIAFAQSLLNDQDWFQELWLKRESIHNKPTLFIWGMKDPFITPHYLDKFLSGFPGSVRQVLEKCGHFPQEEQPEKVSHYIKEFLDR